MSSLYFRCPTSHSWLIKLVSSMLFPIYLSSSNKQTNLSTPLTPSGCHKTGQLLKIIGIIRILISPYFPWVNSSAELFNRTIIKYLRTCLSNSSTHEWESWLPTLQMCYNVHIHAATHESPFFLTHVFDPRLPLFDLEKTHTPISWKFGLSEIPSSPLFLYTSKEYLLESADRQHYSWWER